MTGWVVSVDMSESAHTHVFLIPPSPPHLCLHPPRHSPDCSLVRLPPGVRSLRLALPPRGRWSCSGWSAAAGGAVSCGHRDWMIAKPRSPLWTTRVPTRDVIPACDGLLSRSDRLECREPRCPALLFSLERERLERCEGLKQNESKVITYIYNILSQWWL